MKTKSLFLAALVMISAVVSAVGKDEPRTAGLAVVPVKGSQVFKVIYKAESVSKIKMNIYNAYSQLIFTETFNGIDGFIRPVNFSGMEAGEYTVELISSAGKKVEKINYQPAKTGKSAKNIHISNLAKDGNKYLVSVTDASDEIITVKIYDNANNLIHNEKREVKEAFAQVYVIKNANNVTIEISDEAGTIKSSRF